ncbi:hypothetical protein ES703_112939 [subsurface metagenome]
MSLKKIMYIEENSTIIYKTKFNEYWKESIKYFKATDFIAELTQHIPSKHKHLIRYYGLYSSRTKGKVNKDGSLAKYGYTSTPQGTPGQDSNLEMENVSNKASRRSWARLIQKVYEVDPLICPKCGHELKVIAVITEPGGCIHPLEVRKILECLKRNHDPPFDKVVTKVS